MTDNKKKISQEFIDNVKKYIEVDDMIRNLRNKIKELNKNNKVKENYILEYLNTIDEKSIDLSDGKLIKSKTKQKKAINKDYIQKILNEVINDNNKINMIIDKIETNRETKEKVCLKRKIN